MVEVDVTALVVDNDRSVTSRRAKSVSITLRMWWHGEMWYHTTDNKLRIATREHLVLFTTALLHVGDETLTKRRVGDEDSVEE